MRVRARDNDGPIQPVRGGKGGMVKGRRSVSELDPRHTIRLLPESQMPEGPETRVIWPNPNLRMTLPEEHGGSGVVIRDKSHLSK